MATTASIILYRTPGGAASWRPARTARAMAGLTPPAAYVVAAIVSAQVGASVAKFLFAALGPAATVSLRTAFAALVLLVIWRPHLRGRTRADLLATLALGVTLAGLSLSFYAALERIPLGVAVTLEFAGPLGIALVGSRRRLDLLWGLEESALAQVTTQDHCQVRGGTCNKARTCCGWRRNSKGIACRPITGLSGDRCCGTATARCTDDLDCCELFECNVATLRCQRA